MLDYSLGQCTTRQQAESSMVDYFIASENILILIPCFSFHNLKADLSDHYQISLQMQTHICTFTFNEKIKSLTPKFTWSEDSPFYVSTNYKTIDTQNKIKNFVQTDYENTESLDAASDFRDIIASAESMSLKRTLKVVKSLALRNVRLLLMNKENI